MGRARSTSRSSGTGASTSPRRQGQQVRARRLNGRGYVKRGGLQRAVGREHVGKAVTVVIEEGIATVLDGDRVLRRIILRS